MRRFGRAATHLLWDARAKVDLADFAVQTGSIVRNDSSYEVRRDALIASKCTHCPTLIALIAPPSFPEPVFTREAGHTTLRLAPGGDAHSANVAQRRKSLAVDRAHSNAFKFAKACMGSAGEPPSPGAPVGGIQVGAEVIARLTASADRSLIAQTFEAVV